MVSSIIVLIGAAVCLIAVTKITFSCGRIDKKSDSTRLALQERGEAVAAITERLIKGADALAVNRKAWRGWRTMTVFRVERETSDCTSFYLKDSEDQPLPPFLPGQYITVGLKDENGRVVSRCYSLSTAPDWRYYRITVKRVPGGKVSNLLHDQINVGASLQVRAPSGHFTPLANNDVPLVLIAAGIGITPMISIARHAEKCNPSRHIQLFFQVRDISEAPLLKEAAQWASENPHVRLYLYLSRPGSSVPKWVHGTGRLSAEEILRVCQETGCQFMFCGPGPMLESIQQGLVKHGVPESMVTVEAFESIQKIKAAEDSASTVGNSPAEGQPVAVRFTKSQKSGICDKVNPSILDAAEAIGVDIDSGCRSGQCGACMVKVLKGSVGYTQPPEYGPIEAGQALACVAKPENAVEILA